jgi:ubiquinone/menaquinone biosynthesis C-methylase UbiE
VGVQARFVVGDGRFLPFRDDTFDYAWSYSVLQHFAHEDVERTLQEVHRCTVEQGKVRIQMANVFGLRSFYHLVRRRFREPAEFDVRYWTPFALKRRFAEFVGPCRLEADAFSVSGYSGPIGRA